MQLSLSRRIVFVLATVGAVVGMSPASPVAADALEPRLEAPAAADGSDTEGVRMYRGFPKLGSGESLSQ
jgi:hypothetical protein